MERADAGIVDEHVDPAKRFGCLRDKGFGRLGFGDVAPQTDIGRLIASIMMLLGWGTLAVPTGIVSSEFTAARLLPRSEVLSSRMKSLVSRRVVTFAGTVPELSLPASLQCFPSAAAASFKCPT